MFPYDTVDWSVVDGLMYAGGGTALPGICTAIAAILCVTALVIGQISETKKAKRFD